jgi:hypothetical protein
MATHIHAVGKRPNHTYRLYGPWGERRIPEMRCKADLYELLRKELNFPVTAARWDVVKALWRRSWDSARQQWIEDSEPMHAPQP